MPQESSSDSGVLERLNVKLLYFNLAFTVMVLWTPKVTGIIQIDDIFIVQSDIGSICGDLFAYEQICG